MAKTDKALRSTVIATSVPLMALFRRACQAATAALPWDQTLIAFQGALIATWLPQL